VNALTGKVALITGAARGQGRSHAVRLAENPALAAAMANLMPVPVIEPADVSNAIAWLVSDAARYVTGITLTVDAGFVIK
jgi:NAD(P)-dependent dehydrogenase (short-subunit alcohol dehydrogenase family)